MKPIADTRPNAMRAIIVDSFAGGGGASTGIEMALGRAPDIAINHDAAALAMHAANHPATLHLDSNVWAVNPREICAGRPVALAWFSPDCKHHSKAKGGKPLKRNIRDLAWVVVYWAKLARPQVILLENVEEFQDWGPLTENMKPCPDRRGKTFSFWVEKLRRLGYRVDWRELRACDYGAPTIRKRLFLVARCDGLPIRWPAPTHGAPDDMMVKAGALKPWLTAADIVDWSIPCPSIFDSAETIRERYGLRAVRPLADATLKRIARGVKKFVIDVREPFVVTYGQHGGANRAGQKPRAPGLDKPLGTLVAGGAKHALVAAFLAQHNTGAIGRPAHAPVSTLTTRGTQQQIVAAFLQKYYGQGEGLRAGDPPHTLSTRDTFGLVTVEIDGAAYAIRDIGMRMLTPREQFRAQGFPDDYVIDRGPDGRALTVTEQVRMCGNSVCPPLAAALARANMPAALSAGATA